MSVFYLRKKLFLLQGLSWQTWHGVLDGFLYAHRSLRGDRLPNRAESLNPETERMNISHRRIKPDNNVHCLTMLMVYMLNCSLMRVYNKPMICQHPSAFVHVDMTKTTR